MPENKVLSKFSEKELIFVDSNIFLHHAFKSELSENIKPFLLKIEKGNIQAFTSSLVLDEVFYKLIFQSVSNFEEKPTVLKIKKFMRNPDKRRKIIEPVNEYGVYLKTL